MIEVMSQQNIYNEKDVSHNVSNLWSFGYTWYFNWLL